MDPPYHGGSSATRGARPGAQGAEEAHAHGAPPPGGAADSTGSGSQQKEPPISDVFFDAARRLTAHLIDLRADAVRLVKARRDRLQVRARAIAFQVAILGTLGVFGLVVLAVSAWLAMTGVAGALNALFGTAPWVGSLIVGLAVPILAVLTLVLIRRRAEKQQLRALMEEYRELERRRDLEGRASMRTGHDPSHPAAETPRRDARGTTTP